MNTYEGGSYSAAILLFFIWAYSLSNYFIDFVQSEQHPTYFSATIFPVYKYNPLTSDVDENYDSSIALLVGIVLMFFRAVISNTQLHPQFWGPIITIGIEL